MLQYLRDRAALIGLRNDEALMTTREERDAEGARHLRLGRSIGGVPVAFDQIRIHASPEGAVYAVELETSPLGKYSHLSPRIHPKQALRLATGNDQGRFTEPPATDLVIVGGRLRGVVGAHLAYRVRVAFPPRRDEPVIEEVYLDGVMKLVEFHVSHSGAPVAATLNEGTIRVVDGVELSVVNVREGPEAEREARLPLARLH